MIFRGSAVGDGAVRLAGVDVEAVASTPSDGSAAGSIAWAPRAAIDDGCRYFGVFEDERLVGQVVLHDIDPDRGEALVAYHVFLAADRGRGVGTAALRLLLRHLEDTAELDTVVIITSPDNLASQRLAERCGFERWGTPVEDPQGLRYRRSVR